MRISDWSSDVCSSDLITLTPSETRSSSRPGPLMNALQIAIEGLASSTPEAFLKWAEENSQLDALVVQQLVAHGYRIAADQLSSLALDWLLLELGRASCRERVCQYV